MAIRATRRLADQICGRVLLPGDAGYHDARAVWNAMIDRRPRLIVRCAGIADVIAAVRFARDHDLEIGVRCGGHGVVGHAVPQDGLMIDLTPMGGVRVDPRRRRARVQGGALLGVLDEASQAHGLATTAGNVSHTGVGGLTLGGGMGWLARRYGLSCDNVRSFELVTADGDVVRASAQENPELFWGLRGGGGNFGIVTEFEFELHATGTRALVVNLGFSLENGYEAMRGWRDLLATAPRPATLTARVSDDPDRPGTPVANIGYVWVGDPGDGEKLLGPLRALGKPAAERVERVSYLALQQRDDAVDGHALRRYWKGHYLTELTDEAIERFLLRGTADGRGEHLPGAALQSHGGAIADVPVTDTAFAHRDTLVEFTTSTGWTEPGEDGERIAAARRCAAAVEPFAGGAYVNALNDEGAVGVRRAYPTHTLARLTALKNAYDPENVFHLNHNIAPTTRVREIAS
ncbi:FAD-binding oxidoreductase [Pseudonocardia adelaidensis]